MNLNRSIDLIEKIELKSDFSKNQNQHLYQSKLAKNIKNNSNMNSLGRHNLNHNFNSKDNNNMQSIRLQIDLPVLRSISPYNILDTTDSDEYHSRKSHTDGLESSLANSINTICLQINLNTAKSSLNDKKLKLDSNINNNENTVRLFGNSSTTSGYSSSYSSNSLVKLIHDDSIQDEDLTYNLKNYMKSDTSNDTDSLDRWGYSNEIKTNKSLDKKYNQSIDLETNSNNNSNIYDRLNYSGKVSQIKSFKIPSNLKRLSLCSTSTSSISSSISNKSNLQSNIYEESNVYEEISNFYENSNHLVNEITDKNENSNMIYGKLNEFTSLNSNASSKTLNEKSKYNRKEYSINDIFQNLNTIKQNAKSDFNIEEKEDITKSTAFQKPVYMLKQIFEPRTQKKISDQNSLLKHDFLNRDENLNHNQIMNIIKFSKDNSLNNNFKAHASQKRHMHHSYVNDRINK